MFINMEKERLQKIYRKTDGYCHLCHCKLSFTNYGSYGTKGAWHIEHSKAKFNGGSNHMNNLYAACISCNIDKGTKHTKTIRAQNGITRAPYSKAKKSQIKNDNTASGAVIGSGIGFAVAGPVGGIFGSIVGALIGIENSPNR